jgi:hypothetical protein
VGWIGTGLGVHLNQFQYTQISSNPATFRESGWIETGLGVGWIGTGLDVHLNEFQYT